MPAIDWAGLVNPNYAYLLPEIIVVATMLFVMIVDFYTKEKRLLVWSVVGGAILAMVATWWGATDTAITDAIASGQPKEFFGRMVVADQFSFYARAVLLGILALVTMLSVDYVEKFLKGMFLEFYEVILAATLGMMFMVSSHDFLALYIGLELSSISSYVLAGLLRKDAKSNEAALKYFLNGALASAILLFGFSILYGVSGTTYLPGMAEGLAAFMKNHAEGLPLVIAGSIFLLGGFAFKVAAAPMHLWAPDAYEGAPTPVTGFFSVGPKGAAFAAILRVFLVALGASQFSERWTLIFAVLGTVSMFIGNITALMQSNIKRMMAYSSIAQAGYILTGVVAAGTIAGKSLGTSAVLYYILGYALTNLGIFAVLTHMDQEGGWVNVSDFNGLAQRNPVYAWALLLFFVSLIGIPPTVGFMGKFFLFRAALTGEYLWLALVMAVNSVISVGYYYGVVKAMFLEKSDREPLKLSGGVLATVIITCIGVILVGILAGPFLGYTGAAAAVIR